MERKTPVDGSGHGGPRIKLSLITRNTFPLSEGRRMILGEETNTIMA